ncbi:MAG: regulatory iron-sulfur-containing complex subunit RicT, partial [Gemmatimonadales bacterium]
EGSLVEVSFKGNRREFFHWPRPHPPAVRMSVIVEADRGEDLGVVHAIGELAERRKAGTTHGRSAPPRLRAMLRIANPEEIKRAAQLRIDEDNVRRRAIEKVRSQGLDLKISDTEWQWDKKKLTLYFTAEKRVDFRQLVRQLEGLFGTRVQMWHIGVRDEARRLDGVGRCGRQYCSSSWLPDLRPVKSSVAKDQRLSTLNPAQISGTCGRLMCCLRHEHEFYVQQRKRFPKEGKVLTTATGEEKVVSNDIFREEVTLRTPTGETRTVPLAVLRKELGEESIASAVEQVESAEPDEDEGEEEREIFVEIGRAPQRSTSARSLPARTAPSGQAPPPHSAASGHAAPSGQAPQARSLPAIGAPSGQAAPSGEAAQPGQAQQSGAPGEGPRRRRRRGRRGGRRGRDGGGTPPAPSGGA